MDGLIALGVILVIVIVIIGYFISLYNMLVRVRNEVKKNFSNIDVLLKQRHDELPKLISACKNYMKHERETLDKVTQARTAVEKSRLSGDPAQIGQAETLMRQSTMSLFAVAENYPDLKADTSFQQLQKRISALEEQISDRRELYNDSVNIYNTNIQQIPAVIIANKFGFTASKLLEFDEKETQDIDVDAAFNS